LRPVGGFDLGGALGGSTLGGRDEFLDDRFS